MPQTPRSPLVFKRPVVWVTGASRGIGCEIAKEFASLGCIVALSARSPVLLNSVQKEITSFGGYAHAYPFDVTSERAVNVNAAKIIRELGTVDILVNNAGVTEFKTLARTTLREFRDVLASNLEGHTAIIKAVLPAMMKNKRGWIMNILSTAALTTFTESSAYSASKAGLRALANVLREEVRPFNIRVTNIYPGAVNTSMWTRKKRKKYHSRMMSPKSIAEAVLAVYQMPQDVVVEEIVLRPIQGDIAS